MLPAITAETSARNNADGLKNTAITNACNNSRNYTARTDAVTKHSYYY
jgi:hypothetical protein